MQDQFSRTRLLLGDEALDKLGCARVILFGVGGVGSYAAEALIRSGVGALELVDDDTVCVTNINRQLPATHSTVGQLKAAAMRDRLLDINPDADIAVHRCFFGQDTVGRFDFGKYDYIIDAIDTVSAKLLLVQCANDAGVPVISSMGAGNKLDASRFEVADIYETSICPLARVMRRELRKMGIASLKVVYSKEPAMEPLATENPCQNGGCVCPAGSARHCAARRALPGSVAFVPSVAGLILAGEVVLDLCGVSRNG